MNGSGRLCRVGMFAVLAAMLLATGAAFADPGGRGGGGRFSGGGHAGAAHLGGAGGSRGFAGRGQAHFAPRGNFAPRGAYAGPGRLSARGPGQRSFVQPGRFRGSVAGHHDISPGFNHGAYSAPGFNHGGYRAPGFNHGGYSSPGFVHGHGRRWGGGYWHGTFWPRAYYGWGYPLFLAALPGIYSTFYWGGIPYYYANDAYYIWDSDRDGYVVADPPPVAGTVTDDQQTQDADGSLGADSAGEIYAYPEQKQSEEQQSNDRYECHSWARSQTGFDPTQPSASESGHADDYRRAMIACLDARGYSAK